MMKRMILILMIFSFAVSVLLPFCLTVASAGMGAVDELHISIDVCKKMDQSPLKNIESFLVAGFSSYLPIYSVEKGEFDAMERYYSPYIPPRFRPPAIG
jgi:hypothetical protein